MEIHNIGMGINMNMSSMYGSDEMDRETKPYFGFEYKPFKNKKLKVYYNNSEMMQSIGIMMPVFNLCKKMHMNHSFYSIVISSKCLTIITSDSGDIFSTSLLKGINFNSMLASWEKLYGSLKLSQWVGIIVLG